MDVTARHDESYEEFPSPTPIQAEGKRLNFDMGITGGRDYRALLASAYALEHSGAPVPYRGAGVGDVYSGGAYGATPVSTFQEPSAGFYNDGAPQETPNYLPQTPAKGRNDSFAHGEYDYR